MLITFVAISYQESLESGNRDRGFAFADFELFLSLYDSDFDRFSHCYCQNKIFKKFSEELL